MSVWRWFWIRLWSVLLVGAWGGLLEVKLGVDPAGLLNPGVLFSAE